MRTSGLTPLRSAELLKSRFGATGCTHRPPANVYMHAACLKPSDEPPGCHITECPETARNGPPRDALHVRHGGYMGGGADAPFAVRHNVCMRAVPRHFVPALRVTHHADGTTSAWQSPCLHDDRLSAPAHVGGPRAGQAACHVRRPFVSCWTAPRSSSMAPIGQGTLTAHSTQVQKSLSDPYTRNGKIACTGLERAECLAY